MQIDRGAKLIPAAFFGVLRPCVGQPALPPTSHSPTASGRFSHYGKISQPCNILGHLISKMPFAQLVLGSPGAGKSTYCDGSKSASQ